MHGMKGGGGDPHWANSNLGGMVYIQRVRMDYGFTDFGMDLEIILKSVRISKIHTITNSL